MSHSAIPAGKPQYRRLTTATYIAYGLPALPLAALTVPVYIYIPPYYAQELGLDLAAIGFVLLLARIIDALSGPVLGILSDRIMTRWGRRKPWIAVGAPFALLTSVMLSMPLPGAGNMYLFFWSVALYLAWSAISLPHNAWGAELSDGYHERSIIVAWREGLQLAGTVVATALPFAVAYLGWAGPKTPLIAIVAVAGSMLPLTVLLALRMVPEPPMLRFAQSEWLDGLRIVWRNKPFRLLVGAFLLNGIANSLPATLFLLFVTHVLEEPASQGALLFAYFAAGIVALPAWVALSRHYNKHRVWTFSMFWASLIFVWVPLLGPGDFWGFMAISILSGLSLGADIILPTSMQADVVDADTLASGEQRTGLYFAMWGVATKLSLAGAIGIAFPLLDLIGFDAQAAHNSQQALLGLALLYSAIPAAFKLLATALVWNFPIDAESQAQTRHEIEARSLAGREV